MISRGDDKEILDTNWGKLEWIVSGPLGNSKTMTFGRCIIKPGMANPRHLHPNCDEILHLVSGEIEHSLGIDKFAMHPGDTISIPTGVPHNARCTGTEDAVMVIVFSSADRQALTLE